MTNLLPIVHEDPDFLIVNKPAGLLVHPDKHSAAAGETSVAELLLEQFPELAKVGIPHLASPLAKAKREENVSPLSEEGGDKEGGREKEPARGGIVHRLDREASGLLVVARTQAMYDSLIKQFAEHTIKKEYLVLVYGKINADSGTIDMPLQRYRDKARMFATKTPDINRPTYDAVTHWELVEQYPKTSLLKVTTETGRLHQIRVHLTHMGRPVVGEANYTVSRQTRAGVPKLDRLFLHAARLGFTELKGEQQEFESKLPKELKEYLERVKK